MAPYVTGGAILDVKSAPDVNGNGKADVVVGSADDNVYVFDGATGSKIWNKLTAEDVSSVDFVNDITGDGKPEIVVGSSDMKVYLLNGAIGEEVWPPKQLYYSVAVNRVQGIPDVNGDGRQEVIAVGSYEIECKNGSDGNRLWHHTGDYASDFAVISDVTGDGKPDVVWAEGKYYIYLINGATGAIVKSRSGLPYHDRSIDQSNS